LYFGNIGFQTLENQVSLSTMILEAKISRSNNLWPKKRMFKGQNFRLLYWKK
jgi:hypothetical protein